MKPIKTIMEFLITGCVCTALLIAPLTLQTEAEAKNDSPCAGVGRIARMDDETTNYTPETETPEFEPYIASETVASYQQVTGNLETEELVEVISEADPIIETDIDALIVQVAGEVGLPWELVRAVCWVESGFDPNAKSDHPDYGLMQVWSEVWRSYGYDPNSSMVYDPLTNLRVGCEVLKDKIDSSGGDFTTALIRYNIGDGDADKLFRQGIFSTSYSESVLVKYYEYIREG